MKKSTTDKTATSTDQPSARQPSVRATVIVPKVRVGPIIAGRGARLHLTTEEADKLTAMTPPAIRIEGI